MASTAPLPKFLTGQLKGHESSVSCLALGSFATPFHNTIASGSYDGSIRLWDDRSPTPSERSRSTDLSVIRIADAPYCEADSTPMAITFGTPYLSTDTFTDEQYTTTSSDSLSATTESLSGRVVTPILSSNPLYDISEHALLIAVDNNRLYHYDLRYLSLSTPELLTTNSSSSQLLAQYVAISHPFSDSISMITLSPDGTSIAVCSDDNAVSFLPLAHNVHLAKAVAAATASSTSQEKISQQQIYQPWGCSSPQAHTNIPTSVLFDPLCPFALPQSFSFVDSSVNPLALQDVYNPNALTSSFTAYSMGMDYMINQYAVAPGPPGAPGSIPQCVVDASQQHSVHESMQFEPISTQLVTEDSLLDQMQQSKQQGGQCFNPPFINHAAIAPNANIMAVGLGDGQLALYSVERELWYPEPTTQQKQAQTAAPSAQFYSFLDSIACLLTGTQSVHPAMTTSMAFHPPMLLGKYRGHTHSIVGVDFPAFLPQNIASTGAVQTWLRLFAHRRSVSMAQRNSSPNTKMQNTAHAVGSFFAPIAHPNVLVYQNDFQSIPMQSSSQQRHVVDGALRELFHSSNFYSEYPSTKGVKAPGVSKKGKQAPLPHDFQRNFSTGCLSQLLTCSLDSTMILWKDIPTETTTVYNVARQQQDQHEKMIRAEQEKQIKKLPIKQRLTAMKQFELQSTQRQKNKAAQKEYFATWLNKLVDIDDSLTAELTENGSEEDVTNSPILGHRILHAMLDNIAKNVPEDTSESVSLIEGLYSKYAAHEFDTMDTSFVQARVPLPGKPNAMLTDRRGNAYVATQGKSLYQYHLLRQ